jgi:hypothetical protein
LRVRVLALIAIVLGLTVPAVAGATENRTTDLLSTAPSGGNGASASVYRGASADGARVFFQTSDPLVSADTDSAIDVYERSGGQTTLISTGPTGGNGTASATFAAVSETGTRVFFRTSERLVSADTDNALDVYMRENGTTTLMTTGPNGGNGAFSAVFRAISKDGSRVFFQTSESLVSADLGTATDVYERSGGQTTLVSTGPVGGGGSFSAFFDGASADGSHVFFHTDEALTSDDVDTSMDIYERSGGTTTHVSIGPAGGNGNADFDYDAFFDGASADGSRVWIHTDEVLTFDDTDTSIDVYERSGGTIQRVSTGAGGGNATSDAFFDGASEDGTRVFFDTVEAMESTDTDASYDVYQRSGGQTTQLTLGPAGGNGAFYSAFAGASADGSKVWFHTAEPLVAQDTDPAQDVYEASGGQTTLVSTGPLDSNSDLPAAFDGASKDGARVFFESGENLVAGATDALPDIYLRAAGDTTLISGGPTGGNGDFFVTFDGTSQNGARAFFETAESLTPVDSDSLQDVYGSSLSTPGGYARPKSATPMRLSLVPAYKECTAPNTTHGPPLSSPSCNAPAQASDFLTVGTPDANGKQANSTDSIRLDAIPGIGSTPADEADVRIAVSITDVRAKADLSDYAGELQVVPSLRITDKLTGTSPVDPGTLADLDFPVTVPCAVTADANVGSACVLATTADAVLPGTVTELKRTMWQMGQVKVLDGGPDGVAATADNMAFMTQGIFVP